jgi:hypothetical protein
MVLQSNNITRAVFTILEDRAHILSYSLFLVWTRFVQDVDLLARIFSTLDKILLRYPVLSHCRNNTIRVKIGSSQALPIV